MPAQRPFDAVSIVDPEEERCPCLLLLDTSSSMAGQPIRELNEGLVTYFDQLLADSLAAKRVEVAIVTFGSSVEVQVDFALVAGINRPTLEARGSTPMGEAILTGLAALRARKDRYRENGVHYYRPWVFLITDGGPTDDWQPAAKAVHAGVQSNAFVFFAVGVEGANFDVLKSLSPSDPLKLRGMNFRGLFRWLSDSQKAVSRSQPGTQVVLANPVAPGGWGTIPT